ncbi:MAG: ATP-dependent Clp protease proteolytic subunit, partial [candidate division WOR-3 bacterium]
MPHKRSNLLLVIVLGGGALLFLALCFLALASYFSGANLPSLYLGSDQIASLEIEGVISDSEEFVDQLKEFGHRPAVRSVVLRINSPGGGVAATQEIFEAIRKFRAETSKKVIVSMASVAASGG